MSERDRTNYCPMCVEAQREIAELKAARLRPIDECIEYFSGCASKLMVPDFICGALETIRARYAEKKGPGPMKSNGELIAELRRPGAKSVNLSMIADRLEAADARIKELEWINETRTKIAAARDEKIRRLEAQIAELAESRAEIVEQRNQLDAKLRSKTFCCDVHFEEQKRLNADLQNERLKNSVRPLEHQQAEEIERLKGLIVWLAERGEISTKDLWSFYRNNDAFPNAAAQINAIETIVKGAK